MTRYPPWMAELFAANMAYRPRSRPNFPGDLHHDIRDHILQARAETLSMWTGWAVDRYLAACRMLDIRDDPLADSLETFNSFDLSSLSVAHDHMAAHWRHSFLSRHLSQPGPLVLVLPTATEHDLRNSPGACLSAFRHWLWLVTNEDARHATTIIRRLCLVLAWQNTSQGVVAEMDLYDTLRHSYPFPSLNAARPPS